MSKPRIVPRIELIPWDPTSPAHLARMYAQRVACGWRSDEIDKWKAMSAEGNKVLYWIQLIHIYKTLREDCPNRDELLARHTARYPEEANPLTDTAALPWQTPRQAPQTPFVPAGHIALDLRPAENPPLGFPSVGPVWIAGLYVSWALQSAGLGRAAMAAAEALAGRPPLNGRLVLLDTMPADEQMQPAFVDKVYVQQGNPVPAVASETWYKSLGYETVRREEGAYKWLNPQTGAYDAISVLIFKKMIG